MKTKTTKPKPVKTQPAIEPPPAVHHRPALRSSMSDRVALRIEGMTYLVAPGAVEAFKANHGRQTHHDEGFEAAKRAS